jgi:MtN3 and saliva related transmembrane protein
LIEILGYAAATLTTVSFVPQAIKTLRSGDTAAISLPMYLLFTSGVALWGAYGLVRGDGPLVVANAITLVSAGLILQSKLRAVLAGRDQR